MSNLARSRKEARLRSVDQPSALQASSLILRRCIGPAKQLSHSPLFSRSRSSTPSSSVVPAQNSSNYFEKLEKSITHPRRACNTPDCFLQQRTSQAESTDSSALSDNVANGPAKYPRFHPLYSYKERDGRSLPLEPFDSNHYFSYSGDYLASKRHGCGTVILGDGSSLTGNLSHNEFVGHGVRTWESGATYQGEMLEGEAHGKGIYIGSSDGLRYEGDFARGFFHGDGRLSKKYGQEVFVGRFAHHHKVEGVWTVRNNFSYIGGFSNDLPAGKGQKQYDVSLAKYDGEFLNGLEHGSGRLSTSNGITYTGPFLLGKRSLIPQSLALSSVEVQGSSIADYLRNGAAPNPPHFHSTSRAEKEQALLQDSFLNLQTGMVVKVEVVLKCGEEKHTTNAAQQAGATSAGAKAKVKRQLTAPPRSKKDTVIRTKHLLDELMERAAETETVLVDETGRSAVVSLHPSTTGPGDAETLFDRLSWGETAVRDAFFPTNVTVDSVCSMIGEHLVHKGSEAPKPLFPSRSSASSTGGRTPQTAALRRGESTAPSTSRGEAPSPFSAPHLDVVSPFYYQLSSCLIHGRTEFLLRISPRVRPGEYVLLIRVPDDLVVVDPALPPESYPTIRECVIPIRVAPLDFQTQKMYIARFHGTAVPTEKDIDSSSVAPTMEDESRAEANSDEEMDDCGGFL